MPILASIFLSRTALEVYGVIALGLFLLGLKTSYDHKHEAIGAARVQAQFDAYKAVAIKRSTDLALLWAAQVGKTDEAVRKQQELDNATMQALQDRVETLSHAPTLHFSAAAMGLWDAATAAANSAAPAAAEKSATGTPAVPGAADISERDDANFKVKASAAYLDAVKLFHACRDFYSGLAKQEVGP